VEVILMDFEKYKCLNCGGLLVDHFYQCGLCQDCGSIFTEDDFNLNNQNNDDSSKQNQKQS